MAYRCGSPTTTSCTTTATGEHTCSTGQAVAFYVGDILIGSVSSATAVVTPMDLGGTTAGPTTPAVMNIDHRNANVKGLFTGTYAGTYAGSSSGKWSITIATDGSVSGTSDAGPVTGTMATSLSTGATTTYGFSGSAGGTPWTGGLNVSTKVFSGNWNDGAGNTGTFTGAAAATPATPAISSGQLHGLGGVHRR
jgi:hypothetical protein